ncbi:hypothetical protein H5410_051506 [Solanum commersonii]|uniref:Cullin neddylation domain-containing protein n=1 Tax=Solanum commersonii TaxID=4109 RepID=A0A9J5WZQ4_SOLCO|nr:hypothetical protein H5410_051506 [Solanum commersonii]
MFSGQQKKKSWPQMDSIDSKPSKNDEPYVTCSNDDTTLATDTSSCTRVHLHNEDKDPVEDIGKDIQYAVDACIVRIMKRQKVLPHYEQLSRMLKTDMEEFKQWTEVFIIREMLGNRLRKSEPAQVLCQT